MRFGMFATRPAAAALAAAAAFSVFAAAPSFARAAGLTDLQMQAIMSLVQSFGADGATVANVWTSLHGAPPSDFFAVSRSRRTPCAFARDLAPGASGADVLCLQNALMANGYSIPSGATGWFGEQTARAVALWQKALGISPADGYFGALSRARFAFGTVTPSAGLTIAPGAEEPPNASARAGAEGVPFTRFTLSALGSDIAVEGVVVERGGSASDADFSSVVLIDEANGAALGRAEAFNANHQATLGGSFTVPKGETRSFLVAGNLSPGLHVGDMLQIGVVAVNTAANVAGALPILGATVTAAQ